MTLKYIQVGLGGRGLHWLDFFANREGFKCVALVDTSRAAAEKAVARPEYATAPVFESFERALSEAKADFALVCSPSSLHAAQSIQAIKAGLHVLVEKPLGMRLDEATEVAQRARELQRVVVVAENFRFFPAERTLRSFIEANTLGDIRHVSCIDRRDQSSATQGPWVRSLPNPFLTEIGVHHFDAFRYLFAQQPVAVTAHSFNPNGSDYDHEGGVSALLEFAGGLYLQYSGTFRASRYDYEMRIEAKHGEVKSNRSRVWYRKTGNKSFSEIPPQPLMAGEVPRYPLAGMATILKQFCEALEGRGQPETRADDNLWTLAMLEAALLSVQRGGKVLISEVFPLRSMP